MPQIVVTTRDGDMRTLEAELNQTLMDAIRNHCIDDLEAICGGSCACATCHVFVDENFLDLLTAASEDENMLLEGSEHHQPISRLSCQVRITQAMEGLRLTIAPEG